MNFISYFMSDDKNNTINLNYFNINNKKNSILENAKYQDNTIMKDLNKMELLSHDIRLDLIKKDNRKNVVTEIDFKKKK